MSILGRARRLLLWPPLEVGSPAPKLSLTADEGTWIRLPDFKGHVHVVLLFFRSLRDDATDARLREYDRYRERFEELEAVVFGVTAHRPDRLRDFRSSLGLDYYLLYDPLGLDSRGFRATSRVRPVVKDNVVLVGKSGNVEFARRGLVPAPEVLEVVARLEGREVDLSAPEEADEFDGIRDPGKKADRVRVIGPDEAWRKLAEEDSPYVLLDVRTKAEYEADHAPGAVHIPLDELPHRYRDIGQTTHIICIGQAGDSSSAAAEFLTSIGGSEIYDVDGGMAAWTGPRITGGKQQ